MFPPPPPPLYPDQEIANVAARLLYLDFSTTTFSLFRWLPASLLPACPPATSKKEQADFSRLEDAPRRRKRTGWGGLASPTVLLPLGRRFPHTTARRNGTRKFKGVKYAPRRRKRQLARKYNRDCSSVEFSAIFREKMVSHTLQGSYVCYVSYMLQAIRQPQKRYIYFPA